MANGNDTSATPACDPGTTETDLRRKFPLTTSVRYGIIRLSNAYGSELLRLPMPMLVQYYTGSGWAQNTLDSLTSFTPATDLVLTNYTRNLTAGETTPSLPAAWAPANTLKNGAAGLAFSAPGAGNNGSVLLTVTVPAYLQYNWAGGANYNVNPSARATFGVNKNNQIFMRESY